MRAARAGGRVDRRGRFRHRGHAVGRRAGDELRNGRFKLRPDGLEVIELRIDADDGCELAGLVGPERLASPQHPAHTVAVERRRPSAEGNRVASTRLDVRRTLRRKRDGRRPPVRRPVADSSICIETGA